MVNTLCTNTNPRMIRYSLICRVGLLIGICLIILAYLRWPLWPDHSLYLILGRYWFEGILPYRDAFEQNWPGSIWIAQATLILFGDSPLAVRLFDLLWQAATGAVLYTLCKRYFGKPWTYGCVVLYFSVYLAATFGSTATRDTFASLPLGLALWAVSGEKGRYAFLRGTVAGVMTAAAILIKPTLALVAIFLMSGLVAFGLWQRASRLFIILAGVIAGLAGSAAVFALYFFKSGILLSFFDAGVRYAAGHYAQESFVWIIHRAILFLFCYPPGRLILLFLLVALLWWRTKPKWGWQEACLLLFTLGTLGSLVAQRKFNYVHAMPFAFFGSLAVLLGMEKCKLFLATRVPKFFSSPPKDIVWVILVWLLVLPIWLDLPKSLASLLSGQSIAAYGDNQRVRRGLPPWSLVQEVGEVVRANSPPEARLVCLAGPASPDFYLASCRPPAQRYVQPIHVGYDARRINEMTTLLLKNKIDILLYCQDDINLTFLKEITELLQREKWVKLFETHVITQQKETMKISKLFVYTVHNNQIASCINIGFYKWK